VFPVGFIFKITNIYHFYCDSVTSAFSINYIGSTIIGRLGKRGKYLNYFQGLLGRRLRGETLALPIFTDTKIYIA